MLGESSAKLEKTAAVSGDGGGGDDFYQDYLMVLEVFDKMDPPELNTVDTDFGSVNDAVDISDSLEGQIMSPQLNALGTGFGRTVGNLEAYAPGNGGSTGMQFGRLGHGDTSAAAQAPVQTTSSGRIKRRTETSLAATGGFTEQQFAELTAPPPAPAPSKKQKANTVEDLLSHVALAKQRRRERNKVLARKTRVKKKVELEMLKMQIEQLTAENSRLRFIMQEAGLDANSGGLGGKSAMQSAQAMQHAIEGYDDDVAAGLSDLGEDEMGDGDGDGDACDFGINQRIQRGASSIAEKGGNVSDKSGGSGSQKREIEVSEVIDVDAGEKPTVPSQAPTGADDGSEDGSYDDRVIRCVVVEDSVVQSKMMCRQLLSLASSERCVKVFRCASAETALRFLDGTSKQLLPDIWFIDQNLARDEDAMKGSDLIISIRGRPECARATIVGITTNPVHYYEELNRAGVDVVWGKDDIDKNSMTNKISRLVGNSSPRE